jgi:hypothetical protein
VVWLLVCLNLIELLCWNSFEKSSYMSFRNFFTSQLVTKWL